VNGSLSFESLAADVEDGKVPDWGWELLRGWFETGSYSRMDNAEFLSESFADPRLLAASGLFEEESVLFDGMLEILDSERIPSGEPAGDIAGLLRSIAVNERAAAERFREYAREL
jgi:hypothetical protein